MCTSTSGTSGRRRPFRCRWRSATSLSGRIEAVGSNVADFFPGDIVSGEGHVVCGRCRNCLAGRRHLCAHTHGCGRKPAGRVRRIHRAADDQHLAPPRGDRPRRGRHLRSLRQRRAHRAVVPGAGRRRADHRRGTDRDHGRRGGAPRRRALHRDHGPQPVPPGSWPRSWASRWPSMCASRNSPMCRSSSA